MITIIWASSFPPTTHYTHTARRPEVTKRLPVGRVQLGRALTDEQIAQIVVFLESLTGELPESFARAPVLPAAAFESSKAP